MKTTRTTFTPVLEPNPHLRCRKTHPDDTSLWFAGASPKIWCGRKRKHKDRCAAFDMTGDVVSVYVGE